MLKAVKNYH